MMGKHFSFFAKDLTPMSQNSRSRARILAYGVDIIDSYKLGAKASHFPLPRTAANWLTADLSVKAFYLHKDKHKIDADNLSKPLWDALNQVVYRDDRQIRYLETLKIDITTVGSCEFDISQLDDIDLSDLVDFLCNPASTTKKLLYIEVSELNLTKVRL